MAGNKKPRKRVTTVHEHPRHVPVSPKNPEGITIVDQHLRRLKGTYLDPDAINSVFKSYDRKGLLYPTVGRLPYENSDAYDEVIAVWTDYFNKKLNANPPLDPDVVKALLGSESEFRLNPSGNKIAFGIAQITKKTLKIIQDPRGETKEFIFNKIRQKDLKNPNIAIPVSIRWLLYKSKRAEAKLGRAPTPEEIILEYKGLLKSTSDYKGNALAKFKRDYDLLKKK